MDNFLQQYKYDEIFHNIKKSISNYDYSRLELLVKDATKDIDKKLILGAAIFGLGWGWAGICPGPAIVSLASGQLGIITFVVAMIVGMYFFKFIEKRLL